MLRALGLVVNMTLLALVIALACIAGHYGAVLDVTFGLTTGASLYSLVWGKTR